MPLPSRRRQKPLGPAPLASFDRGLSSECSFDESLSTLGQPLPTDPKTGGRRTGHIGVLCQTSIMEEPTVGFKARTRTIACQTDRSALRDGIRGKQRKSSQSQTSFDQEPLELLAASVNQSRPNAVSPPSSPPLREPAYRTQESLQAGESSDVDRLPSPSRPSTLDLAKKQKKAPTTFSKVQKLDAKTNVAAAVSKPAPPPPEPPRKKDSVASVGATSETTKSRTSSFRSPFSKRRTTNAGTEGTPASASNSRAVSPMLQIRQRIASLSPGRSRVGGKKSVAKAKLEALMNRVADVEHASTGTDFVDDPLGGGDGSLNRQRPEGMSLRSVNRPASASPKPSRKKESHALDRLHALLDRSRLLHVNDHNSYTNHTSADIHHHHHGHSPAEPRRRSKSSPPEPEPYMQHRLSIGAVWSHHAHHHGHGHHGSHGGHSGTLSKSSPSNPPSPFEEEVTKKFSVQEGDAETGAVAVAAAPADDSEDEDGAETATVDRQREKDYGEPIISEKPFENDDDDDDNPTTEKKPERDTERLEEEKKSGETLLTTDDPEEEPSNNVSDLLERQRYKKAQEEIKQLREKVQAEREKRQTFRTAPVERPRSQTREVAVVDLNVYVAEAEKSPAPPSEQRIKLNLHLTHQDQSLDEVDSNKPAGGGKQHAVDPDDWKRFCEQGLLNKRRSRLERAQASESVDEAGGKGPGGGGGTSEWADFNKWSEADKKGKGSGLQPIPMIIETAWTPMEHRILNVTPSPSTCWDTANPDEPSEHVGDVDSHSQLPSNRDNAFDDESFNSISSHSDSTSPSSSSTVTNIQTTTTITTTTASIVIIPPPTTEADMNGVVVTTASAEVAVMPESEPPKQVVPLRKAPAAPTRKAPPPPPGAPKAAVAAIPEPVPDIVVPPQPEAYASEYPTDTSQTWTDPSQGYVEGGYSYDQSAYDAAYYPEYSATDSNYYPPEAYGNYDQSAGYQGYGETDEYGQYYAHHAGYGYDQTTVTDNGGYAQAGSDTGVYGQPGTDSNVYTTTDSSVYGQTGTDSNVYAATDSGVYDSTVVPDNALAGNGHIQTLRRVSHGSQQQASVEAVLGSQTDFTGQDGIMSDPSAIDIGNAHDGLSTTHHQQQHEAASLSASSDPTATASSLQHVEHSPLLEDEEETSQSEEDAIEDADGLKGARGGGRLAGSSAVTESAAVRRHDRTPPSSVDASFQPLTESTGETTSAGDDGSGIDYASQIKHRRLSKVPYTSLDVADNDEEAGEPTEPRLPEEETVTPLLGGATDEDTPLPEPPSSAEVAVTDYDPALYDPAIYDPAGTGFDYNSQEYYNFYYGNPQQLVATTNHMEQQYHQEPSASQPAYEYNTSYPEYPATEDYTATQSVASHEGYYDQGGSSSWEAPKAASPEWPTYNAYVAPAAAAAAAQSPEWPSYDAYVAPGQQAAAAQQEYQEEEQAYGEEEQEEEYYGESTLPKEKLFTDEDPANFGNLRPEPKKKDTSVPLHLKVAKGLKPSKKKIVNLITKGKYSSGKKKDLFDELEQAYVPPVPAGGGQPNPATHSAQWLEYQAMTARAQGTMNSATLKHPPPVEAQPTPSPSEERKGPPARPPVHNTAVKSSVIDELVGLSGEVGATEGGLPKKAGPPGRPPPPKGKPERPPPPPKKTEGSTVETVTQPAATVPDVSDELADFFGGPIPVTKPERPATSVPKPKTSEQPSSRSQRSAAPQVVPLSAKAVTTEIKPVARPKAGAAKTGGPELAMPTERERPSSKTVTDPATTQSRPAAVVPAPVPAAKKTSNVDDLMGLFDMPIEAEPVPAVATSEDPFVTSDPFSTSLQSQPAPETEVQSKQPATDGVNQESARRQLSGTEDETIRPQGDDAGTEKWNGTASSASTTGSFEPWGSSAPDSTETTAAQIVDEAIMSAEADPSVSAPSPTVAAPSPVVSAPRPPARPPPPPRPAPPPSISRKDMFLQSTSEDSDVTFAAAFSHTQDESPTDETVAPSAVGEASPLQEHETKITSQVESMVVKSQPSPTPARKTVQILNSTPWGDEAGTDTSGGGFEADFENDPFGDNTPAPPSADGGGSTADPFGGTDEGFGSPEKPSEEATMLKLVASYKNNAPEKINVNAALLDDSFFDPFATIVPEESPVPVAAAATTVDTTDDDFDVWEAPLAVAAVGKDKAARRTSTNSNASRRTSGGSPQTPLYDEDDTQPMPEFTWDHPQSSWDLLLRSPPKKTFSGTRYWKQIHVRLTDTMLQLFNKPDEQKPFHELPLQGNYMVTEIAIQPLDVFTKIHTTKIEYVFYKERVGIRPGQITKASKGQITKLGLPLEHASQTTELLKFGCLNCRVLRDFVHAVEDVLFRIPMMRDRQMIYKQEEVQAHVIDEFTAKVDKSGIISDRRGRVRVYCLSFVSGMPEVEFGLNDIARKGREVVGRHDILPIYTEEWIRMENVELHHCVSKEEYEKTKVIKFVPPDACFFELVRFRVRPPKSRELPLFIKITFTMEGYKVGVKVEAQTTAYYNRKRAQPCDDIQIRVPIPESWIYLFRTEKLFGYGSKHATSKKSGLIKGMSEKLRTAGVTQGSDPSQIAVTSGSARYEHVYRSLVWRISRLPKEGQGAFANHMMTCRLDLNSYDTMPERFEPNAEIEFTMPAATASHTTLRSISATCDDPPEKWVKYLSKYEYVVEIDYKIDRGDVQLYGGAGATD